MGYLLFVFTIGGAYLGLTRLISNFKKGQNEWTLAFDNQARFLLVILVACSIYGLANNFLIQDLFNFATLRNMPEGTYYTYIELTDDYGHSICVPAEISKENEPDGMFYYVNSIEYGEENVSYGDIYFNTPTSIYIYEDHYNALLLDTICPKENREISSYNLIMEWIDLLICVLCLYYPFSELGYLIKYYHHAKSIDRRFQSEFGHIKNPVTLLPINNSEDYLNALLAQMKLKDQPE